MLLVLLRGLSFLAARLPPKALRGLGAAVGWVAGRVLRIRRAHVLASMGLAGVADPERAADGMYRALGVSSLEFLWLAGRSRADLAAMTHVDEASKAALDSASAEGRGVVIAGAHTGNWELAACAMARRGEFVVVAKRLSVGGFDVFARRARALHAVRLADPEGALSVARATLGRGGTVTMLIDQVPRMGARPIDVSFLGQRALADRAAAALAWTARAPLVVTACRRAPDGRQLLEVLARFDPSEGTGRAWIEEATREATRALERFVETHPTEWLWLHRRWRRAPSEGRLEPCLPSGPPVHDPGHA